VKEPITVSEMTTAATCQRRHFYRYECGLAPLVAGVNLRFGSAWHAAMEARWNGGDYAAALNAALTCRGAEIDAVLAAQVSAMLAGYYWMYGDAANDKHVRQMCAEVPFAMAIKGTSKFEARGKIDGLGIAHDDAYLLMEHKTAGEDIGDGGGYWDRVRYNMQLMQYVLAARKHGWPITRIVYDAVRKPTLTMRESAAVLDADGKKQVIGADGQRVIKANGEPKVTADADKGETYLTAAETPEQYADRLLRDMQERPAFYFQRREVAILDMDLERFQRERLAFCKTLIAHRGIAKRCQDKADAYMAASSGVGGRFVCGSCECAAFCLQGIPADAERVPVGFRVKAAKHEELSVAVTE
jgi:hypothetical protein